MRSELLPLMFSTCDAVMAKRLPTFARCNTEPFVGPGRLYVDVTASPVAYIFFQCNDNRDAFTVDVAWSFDGHFPRLSDGLPRDWPELGVTRADVGAREFRFRLTKLLVYPKYDPWWEFDRGRVISRSRAMGVLADPALDAAGKCEQLCADAVDKLEQVALPYLERIRAGGHGTR